MPTNDSAPNHQPTENTLEEDSNRVSKRGQQPLGRVKKALIGGVVAASAVAVGGGGYLAGASSAQPSASSSNPSSSDVTKALTLQRSAVNVSLYTIYPLLDRALSEIDIKTIAVDGEKLRLPDQNLGELVINNGRRVPSVPASVVLAEAETSIGQAQATVGSAADVLFNGLYSGRDRNGNPVPYLTPPRAAVIESNAKAAYELFENAQTQINEAMFTLGDIPHSSDPSLKDLMTRVAIAQGVLRQANTATSQVMELSSESYSAITNPLGRKPVLAADHTEYANTPGSQRQRVPGRLARASTKPDGQRATRHVSVRRC
jgi:hypothetical protein